MQDKVEEPVVAIEPKKKRGFAAMDPVKQRELARMGGRASVMTGKSHKFTPEEAATAGRKGGLIVSGRDPNHMAKIGKLGGSAPKRKRKTQE